MKIVTVKYQVFKFEELNKDAKEKVINEYYQNELENGYQTLSDDIMQNMTSIDIYFSNIYLFYSLSYSQGDGLSFAGEFNLHQWLEDKHATMTKYKRSAICKNVKRVFSTGNKSRYYYCGKGQIEINQDWDGVERPYLDSLCGKILQEIKSYYVDLCAKLEKYGYSILEYRMSNDEMKEHCESNEYNFFEDGRLANL